MFFSYKNMYKFTILEPMEIKRVDRARIQITPRATITEKKTGFMYITRRAGDLRS